MFCLLFPAAPDRVSQWPKLVAQQMCSRAAAERTPQEALASGGDSNWQRLLFTFLRLRLSLADAESPTTTWDYPASLLFSCYVCVCMSLIVKQLAGDFHTVLWAQQRVRVLSCLSESFDSLIVQT